MGSSALDVGEGGGRGVGVEEIADGTKSSWCDPGKAFLLCAEASARLPRSRLALMADQLVIGCRDLAEIGN